MRKAASIFFLFIFAFNLFGYRLVSNYLLRCSDAVLENALDENRYNEDELLLIKQPLQLPYYTNSGKFESINGEVEIEGITYRFVKYRIYNDSVEMMCLPHAEKTSLLKARNNYLGNMADARSSGRPTGPEAKSIFSVLDDYESCAAFHLDVPSLVITGIHPSLNTEKHSDNFFAESEQPPDRIPVC